MEWLLPFQPISKDLTLWLVLGHGYTWWWRRWYDDDDDECDDNNICLKVLKVNYVGRVGTINAERGSRPPY